MFLLGGHGTSLNGAITRLRGLCCLLYVGAVAQQRCLRLGLEHLGKCFWGSGRFERGPRGHIEWEIVMIELHVIYIAGIARRFDFAEVVLGELVLDSEN